MQFNVGDRVRVVKRHDPHDRYWVQVGTELVIEDISLLESDGDPDHHPYKVYFNKEADWLSTEQLALVSDHTDKQQVFKLQVPEEPAGVDRVRPVGVTEWHFELRGPYWYPSTHEFSPGFGWLELLNRYPEGVEPVPAESDFEVSLDYLRRNAHVLDGLEASGVTGSHAAAVVRGIIEKEGSE